MNARDYVGDMRQLIDAEATGSYVPAKIAREIVAKLRATDADLLAGWLDVQAEQVLRDAINNRDHSQRTSARYSAPRSTFAQEARAMEATNTGFGTDGWVADNSQQRRRAEQMGRWLGSRFTVGDGTRKQLADMRAADLLFVGDGYEARARDSQLMAAFLKAVAKKVGDRTVIEHYTEAQLSTMWDSINKITA